MTSPVGSRRGAAEHLDALHLAALHLAAERLRI
jgi:hypothetical protein